MVAYSAGGRDRRRPPPNRPSGSAAGGGGSIAVGSELRRKGAVGRTRNRMRTGFGVLELSPGIAALDAQRLGLVRVYYRLVRSFAWRRRSNLAGAPPWSGRWPGACGVPVRRLAVAAGHTPFNRMGNPGPDAGQLGALDRHARGSGRSRNLSSTMFWGQSLLMKVIPQTLT